MKKNIFLIIVMLFSILLIDKNVYAEDGDYTVEFTYNEKEYVMKGNGKVSLNTILNNIGINGEVLSYKVSNKNLFKIVKDNNNLYVKSLKPFTSNEWMDVVTKDNTYHIIVTDAQYYGWFGGGDLYWNFNTDTKKLVIRPKDSLGGASGSANMTANPNGVTGEGELNASKWPWYQYRNDIKAVEFQGQITVTKGIFLTAMFSGYDNLETIDFGNFNPNKAVSLAHMFAKSKKIKELDLSKFTNDGKIYNMKGMFLECSSLEKVILNNHNFITRSKENGGAFYQRMFWYTPNLKEIDLSNITLSSDGRMHQILADDTDDGNQPYINNIFSNSWLYGTVGEMSTNNLEKVNLSNTKFIGWKYFDNMFAGSSKLKDINLDGIYVKDGENFHDMFFGCESLKTLDLSSFGKLSYAEDLEDMLYGLTSLEELNLDNLDISNMKHRDYHNFYNRSLFGVFSNDLKDNLPLLKKLSLKNSKVWFVSTTRGKPGNEYFDASDEKSVLYLSKTNQINFESDNGSNVVFKTLRDWVDMITDRDKDNIPNFSSLSSTMPDSSTNLNNKYNLNTNDSGFFAPGVYTFTDNVLDTIDIDMPYATYGVDYEGLSGNYNIDFDIDYSENSLLDYIEEDDFFALGTKPKNNWKNIGDNYIIDISDNPIKITLKDLAVSSYNSNRKDVIITINKITFKELGKIPISDDRNHDDNKYIDQVSSAFRPVLTVSKTDGIRFGNYLMEGSINDADNYKILHNHQWSTDGVISNRRILTGGSGTDIEYSVEVKDAKDNETLLYYAKDLDVPYHQEWLHPSNDACFDNLPINNVIYKEGGEGIVLDEDTVDISKISFAEHTGLLLKGNTVLPTGSDINSNWSGFIVPGNANGMNLTWTSGIACNSEILLSSSVNNKKVIIEKQTIDGSSDEFTFTIKIKDKNNNLVNENIGNIINNNDGSYSATVKGGKELVLYLDKSWTYTIKENNKEGWYQVSNTKTIEEDGSERVIFINDRSRFITLKKKWIDDNNKYKLRPNNIEAYIIVDEGGVNKKYKTQDSLWDKDNNIWSYKFEISKTASVIDWGEEIVPDGYMLKKEENNSFDIYEISNIINNIQLKEISPNTGIINNIKIFISIIIILSLLFSIKIIIKKISN